jgi:hypothetical protein
VTLALLSILLCHCQRWFRDARSIQHCLPIAITLSVNASFTANASFTVNSTSLESSYNVQPYVENGNLVRRRLYGCLFSVLIIMMLIHSSCLCHDHACLALRDAHL